MPINTDLQFLGAPDIEIIVTDTGGGSGSKRVLDLLVCYDPKLVRYEGSASRRVRNGLLLWPRKCFPKNKGKVTFRLSRKKAGKTFVTLCAVNPFTGKGQVKGLKVPKKFPRRPATGRRMK